ATGQPATDSKNPNPALAKRPLIGLPLFSSMQATGANKWSGQIYNADDGSVYASHISVTGADTLRVEGCLGALCGGETWTRTGRWLGLSCPGRAAARSDAAQSRDTRCLPDRPRLSSASLRCCAASGAPARHQAAVAFNAVAADA